MYFNLLYFMIFFLISSGLFAQKQLNIVPDNLTLDLSNNSLKSDNANSKKLYQKILKDSLKHLVRIDNELKQKNEKLLRQYPVYKQFKIEKEKYRDFTGLYKSYVNTFKEKADLEEAKKHLDKLPDNLAIDDQGIPDLIDSTQQLRPVLSKARILKDSSQYFKDGFNVGVLKELTASTLKGVVNHENWQQYRSNLSQLQQNYSRLEKVKTKIDTINTYSWQDMESAIEAQLANKEPVQYFNQETADMQKIQENYQKQIDAMRQQVKMEEMQKKFGSIDPSQPLFSASLQSQAKKFLQNKTDDYGIDDGVINDLADGNFELGDIEDVPKQKSNSLKGSPLKKRLEPGGYVQLQKGEPYTLDLSPQLGYKLNKQFLTGLGFSYRILFENSWYEEFGSNESFSARCFLEYNLKSWIFHSEYEKFSKPTEQKRSSVDGVYVGLGKELNFPGKATGVLMVLYNINHQKDLSPTNHPFSFRIGVKW